jgi:serine/threonine protein kinase
MSGVGCIICVLNHSDSCSYTHSLTPPVHLLTGQNCAIKVISQKKLQSMKSQLSAVRSEIDILGAFKHPHIVRLYQVLEDRGDPDTIYAVMEYVSNGELFDYIVGKGRLHEQEARKLLQQIISAVEYCHTNGVAHRDLKPENLLLDSQNNIKMADFGLSARLADGKFLSTSCGSPNYAAPEVIDGDLYAGPEVDVWSTGVILFAMLCGRLPFEHENIRMLFNSIRAGEFTIPSFVSKGAADLLRRMLTVDPLKRITVAQIQQHAWFRSGLPKYLSLSAKQRIEDTTVIDLEVLMQLEELGFASQQTLIALRLGTPLLTDPSMVQYVELRQMAVTYHIVHDMKIAHSVLMDKDFREALYSQTAEKKRLSFTDFIHLQPGLDLMSPPGSLKISTRSLKVRADPTSVAHSPSSLKLLSAKRSYGDVRYASENSRSMAHLPEDSVLAPPSASSSSSSSSRQQYATNPSSSSSSSSSSSAPAIRKPSALARPSSQLLRNLLRPSNWKVPFYSSRAAADVMTDALQVLRVHDFEWKLLGPYEVRARWPARHVFNEQGEVEGDRKLSVDHGERRTPASVKLVLTLYRLPSASTSVSSSSSSLPSPSLPPQSAAPAVVLDLARVSGDLFKFVFFSETLLTSMRERETALRNAAVDPIEE